MADLFGVLVMQGPVKRDPKVREAVAESNRLLAENAELIKELAAVERALEKKAWKKARSIWR